MNIEATDLENISLVDSLQLQSPKQCALNPTEEKTEATALKIIKDTASKAEKKINKTINIAKEMAYGTYDLVNRIEDEKINPLVMDAEKIAGSNNGPGTIDLLLELSKELSNLNSEKPVLSNKSKDLLKELKGLDIDLLDIDDTKTFSKEQLQDLKTRLNTQTDVQRTKLQQLFTKIQTEMQNIQTMIDSAKRLIADQDRLMQRIAERFLKR